MQALKLLNIANPGPALFDGIKGGHDELEVDNSTDGINFDQILNSFTKNSENEISDLVQLLNESTSNKIDKGFFILEESGGVVEQELMANDIEDKEILEDLVEIINLKIGNFSENPIIKLESKDAIPKDFFSKLGHDRELIFKSENGQFYKVLAQNENKIQLKVIKIPQDELNIGELDTQKIQTNLKKQDINAKNTINGFNINAKNTGNGFNINEQKNVTQIDRKKIKFEAAEDILQAKKNIKTPANRLDIINGYKDQNHFTQQKFVDQNSKADIFKEHNFKEHNFKEIQAKVPPLKNIENINPKSDMPLEKNFEIGKSKNEVISISDVKKNSSESGDLSLESFGQDDKSLETNEDSPRVSSVKINPTSKPLTTIGSTNIVEINENGPIEETISKINNYIRSHYNKSDENLNVTVKHESLGKFQLAIKDNAEKGLEIKILTGTEDGNRFFIKNENEISNNLKSLGLKIGDLKIISSPEVFTEQKDFNDSSKDQSSQDFKNQKNNDNKERKEDSQRRQNLWAFYRERMLS